MERFWLTVVFSLMVFSFPVSSQQPLVGLIQGTIVDQKHAPIAYADVIATNIDSVNPQSNRHSTSSDEKGFYQLVDVPEGRFSIVARKKGYRDYKIPVVAVRGGETVTMPEIKMSPAGSR
jgi:hypothetical protein